MRAFRAGSFRFAVLAAAVACLSPVSLPFASLSSAARAQSDPLTPPPDLGAAGVPVPIDGTAIYGQGTPPPEGMMAIPVPPSTCSGLSSVVRTQGFILVPTGGGNAQRYVRDERYCAEGQDTTPAWLPTSDNPRCFVGYTCGTSKNDGGN